VAFSISLLLVANGKHCHDFMELKALYMIDSSDGNYQAYLRACGWLVLLSMISKKESNENDNQLMVL
jgi:hypothetical protein